LTGKCRDVSERARGEGLDVGCGSLLWEGFHGTRDLVLGRLGEGLMAAVVRQVSHRYVYEKSALK
jgi:hypothetical protein